MSQKSDNHLALLPNGFVDLLPPEAEQEARAIAILMQNFAAFGYNRVKPPLVEFEDSLLAPGPGASLANETFRLMDPITHRMMGIRSDITPQTARIASARLGGEPRPLRLAYANDVLRTKANQQRTERQFCQVGCEIIGAPDVEADIEACVLAVKGLKALGMKDITIDFALPLVRGKVFAAAKVDVKEQARISKSLERRDQDILKSQKGGLKAQVKALLDASGNAAATLKKLSAAELPKSALADVQAATQIFKGTQRAFDELGFDDVTITCDALESKGFEYHGAFAFMLFAKGVRGELGRGGRYDVKFGENGKGESATGFTLYMDTIRRALPALEKKKIVKVAASESWQRIEKLQKEGAVVVRETGKKRK